VSRRKEQDSPTVPLEILVQQLLLGRLEGLSAPQVAAFLRGWTSALELLRRTDLTLPDASHEVRAAVAAMLARIERVQAHAVNDCE
jgi:hypothetical protein